MTRTERQQEKGILLALQDKSLSKHQNARLRTDLQNLRDSARESAKARKAKKSIVNNVDEVQAPQRKDFSTDDEFTTATKLHYLALSELAAKKKLDSEKTSLSGRQNAERELRQIAKRRKALQPIPVKEIVHIETSVYLASLEDEDLLNQRNVSACFAEYLPDGKDTFFAGLQDIEAELDRRGIDWRFWCFGGLLHLYPNRKQADKQVQAAKRNRDLMEAMKANILAVDRPTPPPEDDLGKYI
jgi:hypothetical protein